MFNERLRAARIYKKITQQSIAEHLDISIRSYQRYESGSIEPPYNTLISIADYLDVSIDFLMGRDDYLQSLGVSVDVPLVYPPRHPNAHTSH